MGAKFEESQKPTWAEKSIATVGGKKYFLILTTIGQMR
jgi:hypothetical protein